MSKARQWLSASLDLGGDVCGNGISELIASVLSAVSQFERSLIAERIRDAKAQQRRQQKHLGGSKPFGRRLGDALDGRAPALVEDPSEQAAIVTIKKMCSAEGTLVQIRDNMRGQGHQISHETVRAVLNRAA